MPGKKKVYIFRTHEIGRYKIRPMYMIYIHIYAAQRKLKLAKFALSILPAHVMLYGWIW